MIGGTADDRSIAERCLIDSLHGLVWLEAATAREGLSICGSGLPDCVLLDLSPPDMTGLEVLAALSARSGEVPMPVVVLTGASGEAATAAALDGGAHGYLPGHLMGPLMLPRAVQSARECFDQLARCRGAEAGRTDAGLRAMVDRAPVVLFQSCLAPDGRWFGRFIFGNAPHVLGYSVEQMMVPGSWTGLLDERGRADHYDAVRRAMLTGYSEYDCKVRRADGRPIRARMISHAEQTADGHWIFTGNLLDVTALYESETARLAAEARLAALVDDAPAILTQSERTADGQWRPLYVSGNARRILGYAPDDIIAGGWPALLDAEGRAAREAVVRDAMQTGYGQTEMWLRHAAGHRIRLSAGVRAVALDDGSWRFTSSFRDLTALDAANAARAVVEARLDLLVRDGPGILFQDQRAGGGWRRIYISENVTAITGYKVARSIGSLPAAMSAADEAGLAAWDAAVERACAAGEASCEFRLRHAGGHTIWLRANLKIRLSDGADLLTGYMVDISGERALTEALEDAARDLEQAIDMGPGWLFRITLYPGGGQRLDYSSNNIERVLGYSKNEMRAPGWFLSVLDPAQIPLLMDAAARLLRLEQVTNEYRLRNKSGNWIWISDTQRPAPRAEPDGSVRVVGYATDITAAKERSARLQQTARLAVLGEMAAGMAHEVRQPLAAISFAAQNAEMALERGDFASLATRLGRIVRQTERASGIIEHLRLFGRGADSADIPVPVSLEHVVDGTLSLIGETLRLDCVEVVRAPDGPLPTVMGHQMPLEQVLVNLLLNARDALMANRAPADRRIRIAAVANAMSVRFMVSDNAGGIPPDVMRVVFQPFVTTKLADKGTGLGLSICHGIITDMGGQIRVHNDDEGAVFTIILPAAQ